jgi:uncharacterized GH25 family protein
LRDASAVSYHRSIPLSIQIHSIHNPEDHLFNIYQLSKEDEEMRVFIKQLEILGLSLALILGIFSMPASAHFMWINAGDYTPQTERPMKCTIGWGHNFASPVGNVLFNQEGLDKIYMLDPNGNKLKIEPINEIEFKAERALEKEGTCLVVAKRKEKFFTKTTEGYKRQSKKGLKNVIQCSYSGGYAKAIVVVGKGGGRLFSKPVGHTLEIIPLKDPAGLREGDYLPIKVLYKNKPLKTELYATYVGFSTEGAWAYTAKTNKEGMGKIKILESGIWLIKVGHKVPYPDPKECDQYSYSAALTFEVK